MRNGLTVVYLDPVETVDMERQISNLFNRLLLTRPLDMSLKAWCAIVRISVTWTTDKGPAFVSVANLKSKDQHPFCTAYTPFEGTQPNNELGQYEVVLPEGVTKRDYLLLLTNRVLQLLMAATQSASRVCMPFTFSFGKDDSGKGLCVQFFLE